MFNPDIPLENLYVQIKLHLERMPEFDFNQGLTNDDKKWVAKAIALVKAGGDLSSIAKVSAASHNLDSYIVGPNNADLIYMALVTLMEELELRLPASFSGTFISVGSTFAFHAAFSKVVARAENDVFLVDPYLDEKVLTEFGESIAEGITFRLLADKSNVKGSLAPAARKWAAQYGTKRPVEIRLALPKVLHDRLIVVDRKEVWVLTQSIKDFASRSPGSIIQANELASLKVTAYEETWTNSGQMLL